MTSFHVGPTIDVGEVRLMVVEGVTVDHHWFGRRVLLQARKEPYAVLIRNGDTAYAIGPEGAPMSTAHIVDVLPEVEPFMTASSPEDGSRR